MIKNLAIVLLFINSTFSFAECKAKIEYYDFFKNLYVNQVPVKFTEKLQVKPIDGRVYVEAVFGENNQLCSATKYYKNLKVLTYEYVYSNNEIIFAAVISYDSKGSRILKDLRK
jgi:hypothetical protein